MQSRGSLLCFSCHLKRVLPFAPVSPQLNMAVWTENRSDLKVGLCFWKVVVSLDCILNIIIHILERILLIWLIPQNPWAIYTCLTRAGQQWMCICRENSGRKDSAVIKEQLMDILFKWFQELKGLSISEKWWHLCNQELMFFLNEILGQFSKCPGNCRKHSS